jgi:hypothetical protein
VGIAKHAAARIHWKRAQQGLSDLLGSDEVAALHRMIDRVQTRLHETAQP